MEAQNLPDKPAKRKRGEGTGGRFFVLDKAQWERLFSVPTTHRMNLVLAYLVLLAGTGADHRLTKWSTGAVSEHTGMRKDAARHAIGELIAGKLIERAETSTPAFPHYNVLPPKPPAKGEPEPTPIFLPVGLVTGVTGADTSMLCRMRETGDVLALRLLIDLYGEVTLDAPYAVAIPAMRGYADQPETAEKALEMGAHAIWELAEMTASQSVSLDRKRYLAKGEANTKFWDRVRLLGKVGATQTEPWLCSAAGEDADPIFPMTADAKVREFADAAARALLVGQYSEREWKSEAHPRALVVLPVHHQMPAVLWLTKLRIEADTPGRRGAYGERQRIIAHWIEQYDRLAREAAAGIYANPLRTQPAKASSEAPAEGNVPIKDIKADQGVSRLSNPGRNSGQV